MRGWNHPAGIGGWFNPADDTPAANYGPFTGFPALNALPAWASQAIVTAPTFYDSYYHGLPVGGVMTFDVGDTLPYAEQAGSPYRLRRNTAAFPDDGTDASIADDWMTGYDVTGALCYLYKSTATVGNVKLRKNSTSTLHDTYTLATEYDPTYGLEDITLSESGFNLLPAITLETDSANEPSLSLDDDASWEAAGSLSFVVAGAKWTSSYGNMMVTALAESSWSINDFGVEATPDAVTKGMRDEELERWLELMYNTSYPLYVMLWIAPETTSVSGEMTKLTNLIARYQAAWTAVGGGSCRFLFIGVWRSADNAKCVAQCQAMYNVAQARNDTFFISCYALLGGILWDTSDTGGVQSDWATARGWNAIVHNNGTLNAATLNAIDTVHPADADSAFFFSYILGQYMEDLRKGTQGGSGYMAASYHGQVKPPDGW
jgi:hypothetical protein